MHIIPLIDKVLSVAGMEHGKCHLSILIYTRLKTKNLNLAKLPQSNLDK